MKHMIEPDFPPHSEHHVQLFLFLFPVSTCPSVTAPLPVLQYAVLSRFHPPELSSHRLRNRKVEYGLQSQTRRYLHRWISLLLSRLSTLWQPKDFFKSVSPSPPSHAPFLADMPPPSRPVKGLGAGLEGRG